LILRPPADTGLIPTSVVLQRLHDEMPTDHFTLGWLLRGLHKRSFGIIMLLLALVAITPGLSIVAGLLLMIPAFQMIAGMPAPVFPRRIAAHPLPAKHLAAVVQRAVPMLGYLETVVHPRWHTPLETTKRLVGAVVMILSATLVFIPIPLSNVIPAGDCLDLACLHRGRRGAALDRPAGRRHCADAGGRRDMGDADRRKMDHRSLATSYGVGSKHRMPSGIPERMSKIAYFRN